MQATELALLSTGQMQQADAMTIAAGRPGIVLMERAGAAVAAAALARSAEGAAITVVCGPGNNGGDGFVAARILRERGRQVRVLLHGRLEALTGDAAAASARWDGPILPLARIREAPGDLFIDALFGAGLTRALAGEAAAAVAFMNETGRPIIAVDVPSGVSGDTGQVDGIAVKASETVTFFRLKPGHLLLPGRSLCGHVSLSDIGILPEAAAGAATFRNDVGLWRDVWPRHGLDTHKFRRGAVAVVAGGVAGVGAPRLSARAALRIGAGLATILCEPAALMAHAARGPDALMQRSAADAAALTAFLDDPRVSAVLAGPALGLGERGAELVGAIAGCATPAVLDADALTLLARAPGGAAALLAGRRAACVLTPHEGEFQRLFGGEAGITEERSKLERARKAARRCGAIVVYKGADTVVAAPDGRAAINTTGGPALATAGSGDVLAGLICGLLAQGMPAFEASCAAAWLHGRAGERLGIGLIADDLPEAIPALMRETLPV